MQRAELIAEVRRNLEKPIGAITFTPALEDHYRSAIATDRRRSMSIASVIGMLVLSSFVLIRVLFGAADIDPEIERHWLWVMAALAVVTGSVFLATLLARRWPRLLDAATMTGIVTIAALVCVSFRVDAPSAAAGGIYCYVMVPIAATSLASLHFRQALATTVITDAIFAAALLGEPRLEHPVYLPALLLVSSVSVMALWGNYRTDRDHRRLFLFLTRERLLSEMSEERNAELREMAALDPLTGIANRRAFEERSSVALADGGRRPLAVVMVDVDRFKQFNDRYGHPAGDRCLEAVAAALAAQMRGSADLVARLGGEEFAVLTPGLSEASAPLVLERLRRAVEALAIPHDGGVGGVVTISLGCAVAGAGETIGRDDLMSRADRALYAAKNAGRNRWVSSEPRSTFAAAQSAWPTEAAAETPRS